VVALTSPRGMVTGPVQLRATAEDDVGVVEHVFEVDGVEVARLQQPPWAHDLVEGAVAVGSHTARVTARDAEGNSASATSDFTVSEVTPVNPEEPVLGGCGCTGLDGASVLLLVGLLVRRARRRKPMSSGEAPRSGAAGQG
jgi:hypothetical protein